MVLPLMAAIVRRSAWRGSKSVDASTISSPTFQPLASSTWIEVAPALAVADSLDQVWVRSPCRRSVPPEIMMPRSPMPAMMSSPFTLSVRVMVALRVWGLASVPMASSPCSMIHSVVSSTSALSAKESLPSIVTPPSAGVLTSRITLLSLAMATLSPAAGTLLLGQVAGSDHLVSLAGAPAFWAWTTANTPPSRTAGTSDARKTERDRAPMAITPFFSEASPILADYPSPCHMDRPALYDSRGQGADAQQDFAARGNIEATKGSGGGTILLNQGVMAVRRGFTCRCVSRAT